MNAHLYTQLKYSLDKALYRWLDRQLHGDKISQGVKSCQNFARYKLGMTGYKIDRGGRTASSHIVNEFTPYRPV